MPILSWIGGLLVNFLLGKLLEALKAAIEGELQKKKIETAAAESVKPLRDAQSAEEIDAASDSALDGI